MMTQPIDQAALPSAAARWFARLFEPQDAASLVFFRAAFGAVLLWHVCWFCSERLVETFYVAPPYHLTYFGFEWVRPLPGIGMRLVFYVMGAASAAVALGLFYRFSAAVLFLTFTCSFLSEAALYQNHYYLVCLLAFLLIWIPANRCCSLDALIWPARAHSTVPAWTYWLLRFQIAVPYVFGGVAKLNGDWLRAMPVGLWIEERTDLPLIGPYLAERWCAWFVSYAGLVLDLSIVPLLMWRRTRLAAYLVVVMFHVLNAILFTIDFFPWFMILATTILFPPDWPRRLLRLPTPRRATTRPAATERLSARQRMTIGLLAIHVTWQTLFPLRHLLYPGDPSWTEEGHQFAWRMMLRRKEVFIRYYAVDRKTRQLTEIPLDRLFNPRQMMEIAVSPDQIVAAVPFLRERARLAGLGDVGIRAVVLASLNGRKPQFLVDPHLDLTTVERTWRHQPWCISLRQPLPKEPWRVPAADWPETLGIPLP